MLFSWSVKHTFLGYKYKELFLALKTGIEQTTAKKSQLSPALKTGRVLKIKIKKKREKKKEKDSLKRDHGNCSQFLWKL